MQGGGLRIPTGTSGDPVVQNMHHCARAERNLRARPFEHARPSARV
jgi:hypothetical protein